jgi:hypothetical protein
MKLLDLPEATITFGAAQALYGTLEPNTRLVIVAAEFEDVPDDQFSEAHLTRIIEHHELVVERYKQEHPNAKGNRHRRRAEAVRRRVDKARARKLSP